jgi:cytochrome c peroxidase
MACATCHIPEHAFTVNAGTVAFGRGGQALRRNSPTLLNAELASTFFHDGRAGTLEEQVWFPLLSQSEMWNPSAESVVGRLRYRREYAELFRRAFGDEGVTRKNIAAAIAAYERTLVAAGSRFDRWFYGKEADALTTEEQAGFTVFNWSGCNACHTVDAAHATLTDNRFRNTGVEWARIQGELGPKKSEPDLGRFEISGRPEDRHAFRTPSLRNVALTAPYMHDGSLRTLREVVEWYDRGGSADPGKDPLVRPLRLSETQKRQLEAFLRTLTSDNAATLARTARSGAP